MGLLLLLAPAARTDAADPVKIRVEINDGGFNGKPGDFTIEVEQGALVELTFVWAHQTFVHEEHIMVLEGYRLETDKITSADRESPLRFVADKPGTFVFKCDLDCEIHDFLQRGHLKVKRSGEGAGASLIPTTLVLSPSTWETGGEAVSLTAALQDGSGRPVPKAEVRFFLDADFAGVQGKMELGRVKTDASGTATLPFQPALSAPQQTLTARFEGLGLYDESQQSIEIKLTKEPPPAYVMASTGLENLPGGIVSFGLTPSNPLTAAVAWATARWAQVSLTAVVLAVWATLGYVLYQAIGIRRVQPPRQEEVMQERARMQ